MTKKLCISSDSHVVEPPELFTPLEKRFGERAPRVQFFADRGPQLNLGDGRLGISISGLLQAGFDFSRPDAREIAKKGYELARPGVYDIKARLEDLDLDGLDAEVLYSSVLFNVYQIENLDIVKATFSIYNDWLTDYCREAPYRLFPLACLQLYDLDAAVAEMERCKKMGHVGVAIPCTAPSDKLYSDPYYDKFWAAAQEMSMPLTMHIFTGATSNHGLPHRQAGYALAFAGIMFTVADLIQSGVCERFPNLRFVVTEFETGWIAHFLKRIDWSFKRGGGLRTNTALTMQPSDYWKRNFRVTFEDDAEGIMMRDAIGPETLMWGSDYPHGDSVFPDSQNVIATVMEDCTPEVRYMITASNVCKLYNLPSRGRSRAASPRASASASTGCRRRRA